MAIFGEIDLLRHYFLQSNARDFGVLRKQAKFKFG
jgi:hypothetical protein